MSEVPLYVVTGANGFIGSALCSEIKMSGIRIRALVRNRVHNLKCLDSNEIQCVNYECPDSLRSSFEDASHIVHCAGDPKFGNGRHYTKANVDLTNRIIETTKENSTVLKQFIFLSSIGAVDRKTTDSCKSPINEETSTFPTSDYGRSKLEAEKAVWASNLPATVVRPSLVVGGKMRYKSHFSSFLRSGFRNSFFSKFDWSGTFSVIHVDDLVDAILLLSKHKSSIGETYNCSGTPLNLGSCLELTSTNKRKRIPTSWIKPVARNFPFLFPFRLKCLLLPTLVASDKKLRDLGWLPNHNNNSILQDLLKRERTRENIKENPSGLCVITGAASGLGKALALKLADLRQKIVLIDKDIDGLNSILRTHPNCTRIVADLSIPKDVEELFLKLEMQNCHISELFSCAGVGLRGKTNDISLKKHREIFEINLLSRLSLAHRIAEGMLNYQVGRIVVISSSSAFQSLPSMASYAASNSAILLLFEAWGHELKPEGIQILCACPGGMQTNFQHNAGVKILENEKLMPPEHAANLIIKALNQNKTVLYFPLRSYAMNLLSRILPRFLSVIIWAKLMSSLR